jgi:ATP-dependent Clp protease ATP-binding subunit ClpC
MFDNYTEAARKAVFFARYEAGVVGSPYIEAEHLLLGILREEGHLLKRLLQPPAKVESVLEQIRRQLPPGQSTSASVDVPVGRSCKRAFQYAAEEARQFKTDSINLDHLTLGISRVESCTAAQVLRTNGITTERLRNEVVRTPPPQEQPRPGSIARDLVEAARRGELGSLVGRERELERIIHILLRRTRNNAVLIGKAGIGKTAIVNGLACRIAAAEVPLMLADRLLIAVDASSLTAVRERARDLQTVFETSNAILFVRGLFNLAAAGSAWAVVEAMHALEPHLANGGIQCIATGSPAGLRETLDKAGMLARHFEVVEVAPVSEQDAVRIISGLKGGFEQFHEVTLAEGAIEAAVAASGRFLPERHLPDRAIDLIDEACAAVKLKRESEPREIAEVRRAIRRHAQAMERAIANHEFEKVRQHSDEERREREKLQSLREQYQPQDAADSIVTVEEIAAAVAARVGVPLAAVKRVLEDKEPGELERITELLAVQVPPEAREWLPFLAAFLARCSPAEAAALAQAIAAARPSPPPSGPASP